MNRRLAPVGHLLVRLIVLPLYRFIITTKLRIHHLALPARGIFLFFITNRYLLHGTLALMVLLTIAGNIQSKQAHAQDVGQRSLLFAIATDQRTEILEESVHPSSIVKDANYLGNATLVSIPHIDFDYNEDADPIQPSVVAPGTITVQPYDLPTEGSAAPRTRTETYLVQDGDTIASIARRFGVNVGTVLWNNHLTEREYIRPGDTLRIPASSGILVTTKSGDTLTKLASVYDGNVDEIVAANQLASNESLSVGSEILIPGGRPPQIEVTHTQIIARNEQPTAPVRRPLSSILTTPTPPPESAPDENLHEGETPSTPVPKPPDVQAPPTSGAKLLWPTSGHTITQYYGWRHTGIDIDGDYSSPLYAAADGVVEKAGWNSGGYGLMILIDHPNGLKTRYGHSSKLFVKAGDTVKRGQVIAMMGTTGRSTGTHLHFEVYASGVRTNPLGYIR